MTNVIRERLENAKTTENGAYALKFTGNPLLDLFGEIGVLRNRSENEVLELWRRAFDYDRVNAVKILFYARDVRGGLGERKVFRTILYDLAVQYPEIVEANLDNIVFFGRYDDLYCLVDTPVEFAAFDYLFNAAKNHTGLVGKWLKSPNAHSVDTCFLGRLTAKQFGMSEKEYRKWLSKLRADERIVEKSMSANQWKEISYEGVPSIAAKNYRDAFCRHDPVGYNQYLEKVESGKATIHANTLYPYDIVKCLRERISNSYTSMIDNRTLELQWKALPNYLTGESANDNIMVMADTSGSMMCSSYSNALPWDIAIGLAIYFAQHNHGAFADCFMTFSESPSFVKVSHDSVAAAYKTVPNIIANTNLEAAFDLLLNTAVSTKAPQSDMPKALIAISDMEIDDIGADTTFTDVMAEKFAAAGYAMPKIVYWNVDARNDTFHADKNNSNVAFVSGASASVFKSVIENFDKTPEQLMLSVINNSRYDRIIVDKA